MRAVREALAAPPRFPLGIGTYTYRGEPVDEMIEHLRSLDISRIELSSPDYMIPCVKVPAIVDLCLKLDRAGIKAVSFFCGEITRDLDMNLTVDCARALGVRHVSGRAWGDALKMIDSQDFRAS